MAEARWRQGAHHAGPWLANRKAAASSPSSRAAPSTPGTRTRRIRAVPASRTPSAVARTAIFTAQSGSASSHPSAPLDGAAMPNGGEKGGDQREPHEQPQGRGPLDEREMEAGIFQRHGLVDHGELEPGGGGRKRHAARLGDGDRKTATSAEPERHAEAHANAGPALAQRRRHGIEVGGAGEQREGEDHHQHGRFGEGGDGDRARGADAAEGGADVERGQRQRRARASASSPTMTMRSASGPLAMPSAKPGTSAAAASVAAKPAAGAARNSQEAFSGDHRLLARQPHEVAPGLQRRRAGAAEQPRLEPAQEADQHRRQRQHQRDVDAERRDPGQRAHPNCSTVATASRNRTRAANISASPRRTVSGGMRSARSPGGGLPRQAAGGGRAPPGRRG